ncbi:hypothetical protein PERMA_A0024 (plasmid) [Persephonella marina EX-H1]|uniref:Uncharacterized protein n=1 Tax=Persephonella marina (strain DSM 14350 / EX-H1) TaxID=123214 RepID=C0QUV3_PERMH|nr:hypothetical protein [Persephonella marina]ACO04949.1 hypothetical protein PERMA_A0024 [Persephonella marina EX-H1]
MRKIISIFLSLGLIGFGYSLENLGTFGKVYQIEEEDIIEYIKKNAKPPKFSREYIQRKIHAAAQVDVNLPVNKRDNVRYEKIIYTVPNDIIIEGKLIAKKGTKINVLKEIKLHNTYVILADYMLPYFLDWNKKTNAVYLITQGNILDLQKKYPDLRIYAGFPKVLSSLKVKSIPSIVYQYQDKLVILEKGFPNDKKSVDDTNK